MYNHLKCTLDLVRELSQVALENMRVASEASIQATGRGRRGGGSDGHGRVGGRGDGHKDEDESGSFQL